MAWQWHDGCHYVSYVMYIAGAKFQEHCFKISRVLLYWVFCCFSETTYDVITFNRKTWISLKRKKILQKGKRHSSLLWKAFQTSSGHFKTEVKTQSDTFKITYISISIDLYITTPKHYYYTSDSLWKTWLVESIQSIHNSLWTWHDKCNICCRYCIYHVKFSLRLRQITQTSVLIIHDIMLNLIQ